MEEKKRYSFIIGTTYIDNETNNFVDIAEVVNQQDKYIKELEEKYQDLKGNNDAIIKSLYTTTKHADKLKKENQQLKQSQNLFIVEFINHIFDIFEFYENANNDTIVQPYNNLSIFEYLQKVLKNLKGGKNE